MNIQNIAHYCDSSVKGRKTENVSSTPNECIFIWIKAQQCKPHIR